VPLDLALLSLLICLSLAVKVFACRTYTRTSKLAADAPHARDKIRVALLLARRLFLSLL
jgi:hypothetical protein